MNPDCLPYVLTAAAQGPLARSARCAHVAVDPPHEGPTRGRVEAAPPGNDFSKEPEWREAKSGTDACGTRLRAAS
jgi:hypothetical protein